MKPAIAVSVARAVAAIAAAAVVLIAFFAPAAIAADEAARLAGTWKLVGFENEFQDGSPPREAYGRNPRGVLVLTGDRRFMAIVEAEGRKPPQSEADRAAAWQSMIAYTGPYRVEGDLLIVSVDVAWTPAWVGTEQARTFRLEGDNRLRVVSNWVMSPNLGKMTRATATWERAR